MGNIALRYRDDKGIEQFEFCSSIEDARKREAALRDISKISGKSEIWECIEVIYG